MNYTYYRRYRTPQKRESFKSFFWLTIFLIFAALILKACIGFVGNIAADKKDEAVLSLNKGQTQVLLFGEKDFEDASSSQIILEGDQIKTSANSYSTLEFYNGAEIKIDQNTELSFTEVSNEDENDYIILDLKSGRIFVDEIPSEDGKLELKIRTDVINTLTYEGRYLLSNNPDNEYLYVFEKSVQADLVDRSGGNDTVIESVNVESGQRILISDDKQRDLLNRLPVVLVENEIGDFAADEFYSWNMGNTVLSPDSSEVSEEPLSDTGTVAEENEVEMPEDTSVDEESTDEVVSSLQIRIDSPATPTNIQKDAIAIEGSIVSGTASKITVTWGGNGQPYTLAGFKPGDTSFRYVADFEYKNLSHGENTYTIVAYDEAGNVSNTVVVVVNASF